MGKVAFDFPCRFGQIKADPKTIGLDLRNSITSADIAATNARTVTAIVNAQ
jgi:hypothetical protein